MKHHLKIASIYETSASCIVYFIWYSYYLFIPNRQIHVFSYCALQIALYMSNKIDTVRQVDLVDYLVRIFKIKDSEERRNERKVRFSLFPSRSSAAGDKTVFTSFNLAFLLGDITDTKVSNIYFYPYIGFGGQYGFQIQPNIWLREEQLEFHR